MAKFNHAVSLAFSVISSDEKGEDFTPQMLREALLARIRDLDNSPRAQEWLEAIGAPDDTFEEEEQPEPVSHEYEFSMKIYATLTVTATSEEEAVAMIEGAEMQTANLGAYADGTPVVVTLDDIEDGSGGDWKAFKIDGKEV